MKKHSDGSLDWDEYFQRVRREHAAAEAKQLPCPQHIIELSQHDPLTRAYVVSWRDGAVTWEQMLIGLVTAQAAQLERFRALAVKLYQHAPLPQALPDPAAAAVARPAAHAGG